MQFLLMAPQLFYLLPSPESPFSDQGSHEITGETRSCCKFYRHIQRPRWVLLLFFWTCSQPFRHFYLAFLPLMIFSTLMAVIHTDPHWWPLHSAMRVLQKELQDKTRELIALKQQLRGPEGKDFSQSQRLFKDALDINDYIQQSTAYNLKL